MLFNKTWISTGEKFKISDDKTRENESWIVSTFQDSQKNADNSIVPDNFSFRAELRSSTNETQPVQIL